MLTSRFARRFAELSLSLVLLLNCATATAYASDNSIPHGNIRPLHQTTNARTLSAPSKRMRPARPLDIDEDEGLAASRPTTTSNTTPEQSTPSNDNFSGAQSLEGETGSVSTDNSDATREEGEPNHAGCAAGFSVWYAWQAATNGNVVFDTSGSSVDTVIGIYTGNSVGSLVEVASNDDAPTALYSVASFAAMAGNTYYIAVDIYSRTGYPGALKLNWFTGNAPQSPMLAATGKLVFASRRGAPRGIFLMNGDGSVQRRLTDKASYSQEPAWSPDGNRIAFSNNADGLPRIYVMDADGSNELLLSASVEGYEPTWSPDGTRIAFTGYDEQGMSDVYVVNPDSTGFVNLTHDPTGSSYTPRWSPDGSHIMFLSYRDNNSGIYVMNADGTNQTHLTSNMDDSAAWSPDGTKIAFVSWRDNSPEIYVMNADGSGQTNLTNTSGALPYAAYNYTPAWSPDGTRLAFASDRDGNQEVYVMNADGTNPTRLTNSVGSNNPCWSPDGTRLAFNSYRDGNQEIYVMDADGGNPLRLTNNPGYDSAFSWQPAPLATGSSPNGPASRISAEGGTTAHIANASVNESSSQRRPLAAEPEPTPDAALYVFASAAQYYVPSGGTVNYSVTIGNMGPFSASDVTLTGKLPNGVTLNTVADNTGTGSCTGAPGGSTFTCTYQSVEVDASKTVTVSATVTGTPYAALTATFTGACATFDSNPDDNMGVAQFYIAGAPLPTPTPGPPDEAQLAYATLDASTFQYDLVRLRADGTGLSNLTNSPVDEQNFFWSSDGAKLAFLRYDYASQTTSAYTMDADGSNLAQLTNVPGENINQLIWSPDNRRLLFSAYSYSNETFTSQIYVVNADGTERTSVSGTDGFNTDAAWSPDGTRISFTRSHYFPEGGVHTDDIYIVNSDGSSPVQIVHEAGARDYGAVWSPRGTHLAFMRLLPDNTSRIYVARSDGSEARQFINDPDVQTSIPQWAPDGRLSFSSYNIITSVSAIEAANADGSGRATIYSAPQGDLYYGISGWTWSPDGTRLALSYITGEAQGANVCVVNADGAGLQCIGSSDQEYNSAPDWSPDGARLAFISNRNGVRTIDLVNADLSGRVELVRAEASSPKWRPRRQ